MNRLVVIASIIFLNACTEGISQNPSEDMKKEAEFQEVMRKAKETRIKNQMIIKAADEKAGAIITNATKQIVTLKEEVKELKQEINETNIKRGAPPKFKLLPITDSTEN